MYHMIMVHHGSQSVRLLVTRDLKALKVLRDRRVWLVLMVTRCSQMSSFLRARITLYLH